MTQLKVVLATVFGTFGLFAQAIYYLVITGNQPILQTKSDQSFSNQRLSPINLPFVIHPSSGWNHSGVVLFGLCCHTPRSRGYQISLYQKHQNKRLIRQTRFIIKSVKLQKGFLYCRLNRKYRLIIIYYLVSRYSGLLQTVSMCNKCTNRFFVKSDDSCTKFGPQ